jgi:hypothetical protein
LDELRRIIAYLKQLHPEKRETGEINTFIGKEAAGAIGIGNNDKRPPSSSPLSDYQQLTNTPAWQIKVGRRNAWLFSNLSKVCRQVAGKYRKANDCHGLTCDARTKAELLNTSLETPLPEREVQHTVRSVVSWCLNERFRPLGRSSEEATYINRHFRWGLAHVTVAQKANSHGISRSSYYRKGFHRRTPILSNEKKQELLNRAFGSLPIGRQPYEFRRLFTKAGKDYHSCRSTIVNDDSSHLIPSDRDCLTHYPNHCLTIETANEARGPP